MASYYIQQIREVQPTGPFKIGGWSLGGTVAFEVARQLVAAGETVGLLALLDCPAPISIFQVRGFLTSARAHVDNWLQSSPRKKLSYVADVVRRRLGTADFELRDKSHEQPGGGIPKEYKSLLQAQTIAARRYRAKPHTGRAVLFRTKGSASSPPNDPTRGWGKLIRGGLEIQEIPGDHLTMLTEPHVHVLAEKLCACARSPR